MSKQTKYDYHRKNSGNSQFSSGYCDGWSAYKRYPEANAIEKASIRQEMKMEYKMAQKNSGFEHGFICGVRDASYDSKKKKRKNRK